MCHGTTSRGRASAVAPPRWGLLYAGTLPQLAALAAVEAAHSPHLVRLTLRCLLAVSVFAAMSAWLRSNRPALDLQDWCDCAGDRMTIRVIDSPAPTPAGRPFEPTFISAEPTLVEEDYELAGR